jgi:hypothetical protein
MGLSRILLHISITARGYLLHCNCASWLAWDSIKSRQVSTIQTDTIFYLGGKLIQIGAGLLLLLKSTVWAYLLNRLKKLRLQEKSQR